jgi:hypothetical protein
MIHISHSLALLLDVAGQALLDEAGALHELVHVATTEWALTRPENSIDFKISVCTGE